MNRKQGVPQNGPFLKPGKNHDELMNSQPTMEKDETNNARHDL
jgi:hypothetical protein